MDLQAIGRRVHELRSERGLSREALAKLAGVHLNTVANVEAGKRDTGVMTLSAIAAALGVQLTDIVDQNSSAEKLS